MTIFINDFALVSRLGMNKAESVANLQAAAPPRPDRKVSLIDGGVTWVGELPGMLSAPANTRTNQITAELVGQLGEALEAAKQTFGKHRVAGVIGTSTTGIEEAIAPLAHRRSQGAWPENYTFADQELGDTAAYLKQVTGIEGPCHTVSTACTSGSKAVATGARLIRSGLADAVICGGVDSLSRLTTNGFNALDSVSPDPCVPFSANRSGINIGEGGALFILSRAPGPARLLGWGESSDAYHVSAPDPTGSGAMRAIRQAFAVAGLGPGDMDFVHLHGTATPLNDAMEATLVNQVFGAKMPCASTKGMTGHTLGAAGALQLAINLLAMEGGFLPPHVYDDVFDDTLAELNLVGPQQCAGRVDRTMCLSYAFGGSNAVLIAGRG